MKEFNKAIFSKDPKYCIIYLQILACALHSPHIAHQVCKFQVNMCVCVYAK